jgi:VWFA-related protein
MNASAGRLALAASMAVVTWSVLLSGVPAGLPQAPQKPAQAGQPSFRSGTELVVIDVSAVGNDGKPLKGLRAEDFTVRIDNGARRIVSMQFIDQAAAETQAPAPPRARRYSSNEAAAIGRLIVILVDESSIRFGGLRAAAESTERLLAGFGPADRIALVALPGPRMLVPFTADHAQIASAVKTIPGGAMPDERDAEHYVSVAEAFAFERGSDSAVTTEVVDRECATAVDPLERKYCMIAIQMEAKRIVAAERKRTEDFIAGLRGLLTELRVIDVPKLVVVFSEGFASPESPGQMAAVGGDAVQARAVLYAMRLDRSLFDASSKRRGQIADSFDDRRASIAALDTLTGSARGTSFEVIGSAEDPFKRLAAEVSGYYLIGIEPEGNDRDGRVHQIRVSVNRPGVTLRSRREFAFRPAVTDEAKVVGAALASPLVAVDLPIRVGTFNLADEDPTKVHVLIVAEIGREAPQEGSATIGFVLIDEKGKPTLNSVRRMTLPRSQSGALLFAGKFPVPAGTYTLRFAAVHDGRVGSVDHRIVARLTPPEAAAAKPAGSAAQIGDLMLMPPSAGRDAGVPLLDGRVRTDQIVAFAQTGADQKTREERTFVFDVVKQDQGPALVSVRGLADPAEKGRVRTVAAAVDARLLPPGDYSLRLTVSARGAPVTTLFSPFSLERSPSAGRRPAAPALETVPFNRQDVLEPPVLGLFLEEVARVAPASSRPALEQARLGQFDEALERLKPGTTGDPTAPLLRGLSLFAKGEIQAARDAFSKTNAAAPQLGVGTFYMGACYAAGGVDATAINVWQTSLIMLSQYPVVYRMLADALIRTGQPDRARVLVEQAAKKWPGDETIRARVMRSLLAAGRYENVLEYADQAIEQKPVDSAALFLAMESIFEAIADGKDTRVDVLLPRLQRCYELYVAAGGPRQALAAEWLSYLRTR